MISHYEDIIKVDLGFICLDCSLNTLLEPYQYYMVHDEVWDQTGIIGYGGMLCIECLEARIGRDLEASDFTNIPMNKPIVEYLYG